MSFDLYQYNSQYDDGSKLIEQEELMKIMKKEFAGIDENNDGIVTRNELFTYIQEKSANEVDEDVVEQIFDQIDGDGDGNVTIEEFIKVFLEADNILRKKLKNSNDYIRKYDNEIQKAQKQLKLFNETEQRNKHGVMAGSYLNLVVIEAKGLKFEKDQAKGEKVYVFLTLGNKKVTRTHSEKSPFKWERKWKLEVDRKDISLKVEVFKEINEKNKNDISLGVATIDLLTLEDQYKNEQDYILKQYKSGNNNNVYTTEASIRLVLQLVYSKVRNLYDFILQYQYQHFKGEIL